MRCGAVPNQSKSYVYCIYIYIIHCLCLYIYDNWEWHVEEPTMISKQNTPDGFCFNRHWSGRSCPWCCPRNVARTTFARSVLSSHPFSNRQYKQLPSPSITYWKDKDWSLKIDAAKKGNHQSSPREWDGNKKVRARWGLFAAIKDMPSFFDDEWFVSFGDGNTGITGPKKWSAQWYPCGLLARKLYTRSRIYMDATELLLYILGPCQSRCFVCDGIPSVSDFAHLLPWTCHSFIKPWNPLDGAHGRPWR